MPKWFDMGKEGVKLRFVAEPKARVSILVLLGVEKNSREWELCQSEDLGFKPSPTGKALLIRKFSAGDVLKIGAIQAVFPRARQIEIGSPDEVRLRLDSAVKLSPQEMALAAAMKTSAAIGTNALNQQVFENPAGGRFVIDVQGQSIEETRLPAAFCLRANDTNLHVCAQGFVLGLMGGAHAEASDVARFVDVLYGPGHSGNRTLVEKVSQEIEAQMSNRLLERHKIAGDGAYREAQALYENSPPHMGEPKGAGAVPLPVSVAVQELVRAFGGDEQNAVYIPRLYDGAMAAMLGQSYGVLTEMVDPESREGQMRRLIPQSVNMFERGMNEAVAPHRISVLNVEDNSEHTLTGLREDMGRRHPNGLSVLLFPDTADSTDAARAQSRERTNKFMRELQSDYSVMGIGVVSPVMRKKLGLNNALNMAIVGHKFGPKEKELRGEEWVPRQVVSMYDWDKLRTFTNDVLVCVHEEAGHKLTAEEETALRANENSENSYQLPYQSFSKNGEVELMIPRNLAGATYKALQSLQDRVGDLDLYVKNAIGFDDTQFSYLVPEQVDAAALMVAALDRGKGFVLGDQTGAGKGATIATAVSYAWSRGLPVIFVTKQDNLFSDFYRDLKKTGLHTKIRPLVLNHSAQVFDQFSETLEKVASGVSRKDFLQNYRFGLSAFDNPNIIFTTYSQFSAGSDSEKSDWIKSIAPNAVVIFDEAHIAAGDSSQLGEVCTNVADSCKGVVYSSATWLKDARQMRFFQRVLPASVDAKMVSDAMNTGGENIQEVFSAMLAEDGLFIRRERDASELDINAIVDEARLKENEAIANNVSLILQGLQRLCGVTDQVGRRLTKSQVDRLDAAQKYIKTALERAGSEVQVARAALRADQQREIEQTEQVAEAIENTLDTMAQEAAGLVEHNPVQDNIDAQSAFREQAYGENEEVIESGQASNVIDMNAIHERAVDMLSEEGDRSSQIEAELQRINDLKLEDFGLAVEVVQQVNSDIDNLGSDSSAQRRLEKEVRRIQKMMAGIKTRTTSFGSLLFLTQRTLNVSLQARFAAERAIEAIRNGLKPIIFLEQTFEGRLAEELESPDAVRNEDGTISIRPLTLKDNLRDMYTSIVNMTHVDANGEKYEGTIMDSRFMASDEERDIVREGLKTLDEMIEGLPHDLYCSPIDTICYAIRQAGYAVGEATGRKYQVVSMEDGVWKVALRKKHEAKINYIERAFNFGEYDALVGNKAMSTGLSVHASRDFTDQRQRVMMFIQVFADINDYIQAIGRADRRGQIIPPLLEMLASGLPSEARVMMNHYDKLRKLLASTTSNRSSRFEQGELPDLFNSVGDRSVRDFLQANPGVATRLGIDFQAFMPTHIKANNEETEVQTRGLAKFVVARLDLLPVSESRSVYQEIAYNFAEVINELDAQGINPLRTNVIDLTDVESAMVTNKEDLMPARLDETGEVGSVFDEAVELHTVSIKETIKARTWEETLVDIERETRRQYLESISARARGETPDFVADPEARSIYFSGSETTGPLMQAVRMVPSGLRERVTKMFDAMQIMMRSSDTARRDAGVVVAQEQEVASFGSSAAVDQMSDDQRRAYFTNSDSKPVTPTQVIERRKNWLLKNLSSLMPGQYVSYSESKFGWAEMKSYRGVIISLNVPPKGRETNLSRWSVNIQFAGYSSPHRFTLQELYKNHFRGLDQWLPGVENIEDGLFSRPVPEEFNDFGTRHISDRRYVMRGNLFRAASIAAEHNMGAGGVLQLKNEAPARVISIRKGMTKDNIYASVPVELSAEEAVSLFCTTWANLNNPPSKSAAYWTNFLRRGLEARGIHSSKDAKGTNVSLYWMPSKTSLSDDVLDGTTEEERADQREHRDTPHMLSGIGVRVHRASVDKSIRDAFVAAVNSDLGYEAVKVYAGRASGSSSRYVVRFANPEGERDTDDLIRTKLAVVARQAAQHFGVRQFYTHSPEMRLLSMAVSAQNRENARRLRDAADEVRTMRVQMSRLHFAEHEEEPLENEEDSERGELPVMDN